MDSRFPKKAARVIGITGWITALLLAGCEHIGPIQPGPVATTLTSIQNSIFSQRCALSGCHLGAGAPFGLDLSTGNARGNIVNVPSQEVPTLNRVTPGDPDNSYLVRKIEGAPGIVGERMPRGRPPLSREEIDAIRSWISEGARDN